MEFAVKPQLRRFLAGKVRSGQFKSQSDVINFALDRLKKDESDLEWLKSELQKGIDASERGEVTPWDVEEEKTRFLQRVARQRRRA